jgi:Dyggve-Melchior-Clausen syndrome protein
MEKVFELFSSPKFLYSGEFAYRHLALLLEVFNNIMQYQYHGNTHLVYAIVRRKDSFGQLASLNLERAQAQCHKVYGEQTTVTKDHDSANNFLPVSIETKGIPTLHDDQQSQVSSVAGTPFQPSKEWLDELKGSLAMETVSRLLQHLVPVVDTIVTNKQGVVDEQHILDVLNEITMVGLLPVPHPIIIRKYQPNQYTALWFTAFMWGVIFLRNQGLPLFDGQCVELFQVALTDEDDD